MQRAFLRAFVMSGSIATACRAARVSKDAVHDWRRKDNLFAARFQVASDFNKLNVKPFLASAVKSYENWNAYRFNERREPPSAAPSRQAAVSDPPTKLGVIEAETPGVSETDRHPSSEMAAT